MSGSTGLTSETGTDCNRVKISGRTELLGNPDLKKEKPHTIILFPGGHLEIARTSDNNYWVRVAVRNQLAGERPGRIIDARIDHEGRYNNDGNAALRAAIAAGDVNHIAFLVEPA